MVNTPTIRKGAMTDRVRELRSRIVEDPPALSVKRMEISLQVMREMEGQPPATKRARVFERYLDELPVAIDENPIAGRITEHLVAVYPQPEYSCHWILDQKQYSSQLGNISFTEQDTQRMREAVEYWEGKSAYDRGLQGYRQLHGNSPDLAPIFKAPVFQKTPVGHAMGTSCDFARAVDQGLNGVIAEVEAELAKLVPGLQEDERKRTFYDAILVCLRAIIRRAGRYSALASKMARDENDIGRKKELERVASALQWVPANPARTFFEAVQSFWFVYAASHMEDISIANIPGRLGQLLDPYYEKDKEEGRITEEEAIELLEFLFLRGQALVFLRSSEYWSSGMGQTNIHISLGGLTADGDDATGAVDWLILEAQRRVRCIQPTLTVYVHDKMSEEFLLKCVEVIKETGLGQPAFVCNDIAIQHLLRSYPGVPLEEVRSVASYGCVPAKIPGRTDHLWSGSINMPKMLELALNDGKDPMTGIQIGPMTGAPESFQAYEDVELALRTQMGYFFPLYAELTRFGQIALAQVVPCPLQSALIDDCIRKGRDVTEGGARYQHGSAGSPIGMIDVANSLAAIRKLVFEDKRLTMSAITEALAADFEGDGHGEVHRLCLDAPKFGNDDMYADALAKKWYGIFFDEMTKHVDSFGRPFIPLCFSISNHFGFGIKVGALPSGRKAGIPLTDATASPMPGTDRNGPTALVHSAARVVDATKYSCNHFNMKFHPSSLASMDSMRKLLALVRTYMDLGGMHVQFNVISGETLRDAQVHPEKHRNLLVRVAGFSAFYVLLDWAIQEEILKRTELRL